MAVTWGVVSLDSTKTVGSLSDVVTTVHWTASDSETVGSDTYTGSSYGSVGLADAVSWAKAAIGADEVTVIETSIAAQITEAKTPTVTAGVPW